MTRRVQRTRVLLAVACGVLSACGEDAAGDRRAAQEERGRQLLSRYHCGTCHAIPGAAASRGSFAASLEAYGRRSYIAGRVANEPDALARWIVDPAAIVPGTLMPNMGVSTADARDMAAYLERLR